MGDVVTGRFGNRATVSPMEAWVIDLENISPFDDELRIAHLAKCPEPDSPEYMEAVAWQSELEELRKLRLPPRLSVVS